MRKSGTRVRAVVVFGWEPSVFSSAALSSFSLTLAVVVVVSLAVVVVSWAWASASLLPAGAEPPSSVSSMSWEAVSGTDSDAEAGVGELVVMVMTGSAGVPEPWCAVGPAGVWALKWGIPVEGPGRGVLDSVGRGAKDFCTGGVPGPFPDTGGAGVRDAGWVCGWGVVCGWAWDVAGVCEGGVTCACTWGVVCVCVCVCVCVTIGEGVGGAACSGEFAESVEPAEFVGPVESKESMEFVGLAESVDVGGIVVAVGAGGSGSGPAPAPPAGCTAGVASMPRPSGAEESFGVIFGPYSPGIVSRVSNFEWTSLRKPAIGESDWARRGCTIVCRIAWPNAVGTTPETKVCQLVVNSPWVIRLYVPSARFWAPASTSADVPYRPAA